ncbi:MAG: hypothetical protein IPF83_08295 [Rhodanobacteraceae bacterium]|nr:hypothetical protein [Rhodanobacteraceae bacterium]
MRSRASNPRPAIEAQAKPGQPLGMSVEKFLSTYWQKRPLLIRGMLDDDFASPISPNDLAGLACEPQARARLVTHDQKRDRWALEHGPFAEARFANCQRRIGPCWCKTSTNGIAMSPACSRMCIFCRAGALTTSWSRMPSTVGRLAHASNHSISS